MKKITAVKFNDLPTDLIDLKNSLSSLCYSRAYYFTINHVKETIGGQL